MPRNCCSSSQTQVLLPPKTTMPFSNIFRRKNTISINEPEPLPTKEGSMLRRLSRRSSKPVTTTPTTRTSYNGQTLMPPSFPAPAPSSSTSSTHTAAMGAPGNMHLDAPPPTYNEAVTSPSASPASADDPFAFLSTFDTVFLIDDSGSMAGSSWRETSSALAAIAPICAAHDADGVDIHFMNTPSQPSHLHLRSATEIREVFTTTRPWGPTPTGTALNRILRPYLRDCETRSGGPDKVKPLNIIVITDGVPTDDPESVIVQCAKRLERMDASPHQVGIQFFQVGREPSATEALKDLDDGLVERGCARDIVDTVPWKASLSAEGMLKVVLGAVNRRLDRKRVSGEERRG